MLKIGIIREGKVPPDNRVALTPPQCADLQHQYNLKIAVQPCAHRCYSDTEYLEAGISINEDVSDCDILMGIKEVPVYQLIPNKTYCFFSHTIKLQKHNQKLLQHILKKGITLMDYEVMTDDNNERLIAFGFYAGIVGAYNGLWSYGKRTGIFDLPRMKDLSGYSEALQHLQNSNFSPFKIVVTGTGRVGKGAVKTLTDSGIYQISPSEFLENKSYNHPVFTVLRSEDYVRRKSDGGFSREEFHKHPEFYESTFNPYLSIADIFINCIFWKHGAPVFFDIEKLDSPEFRVQIIADVTCDIAPESSIPTTFFASTIPNPIFGVDKNTHQVTKPFLPTSIDMMSIDNLPNELARDASQYFGNQLITNIIPHLIHASGDEIIQRATIVKSGILTDYFQYMKEYSEEYLQEEAHV